MEKWEKFSDEGETADKIKSNLGAMTPWRASEKSLNIQWFLTSSPGLDLSLNKIEGKFAFDFYITVLVKTRTDVRS